MIDLSTTNHKIDSVIERNKAQKNLSVGFLNKELTYEIFGKNRLDFISISIRLNWNSLLSYNPNSIERT